MKTRNLFTVPVLFLSVFMLSCNKNDMTNKNRDYFDNIIGTYKGEFTSKTSQDSAPGTASVTKTDNDEIQIHCYGETMDTVILMDAYENGDSVMLCNTDSAFYNEYGHMGHGYNMMNMDGMMEQSEWMQHQQQDHQEEDTHYGSFDMENHTFNYAFKMTKGDTTFLLNFRGNKN